MYEVNYNNFFYCRIRPKIPLYDAERNLLAIAKFLVTRWCIIQGDPKSEALLFLLKSLKKPGLLCVMSGQKSETR